MKTRKHNVYWFPIADSLVLYYDQNPPTSVYEWYVKQTRGREIPAELHCPAVRLVLQNTYVFYNPISLSFEYDLNQAIEFYGFNSPKNGDGRQTAGEPGAHTLARGSPLIERRIVCPIGKDPTEATRKLLLFHPLSKGPSRYSSVLQLQIELVLTAERPLWVEQLPPYLHEGYYESNLMVLPGSYDFSNWVRSTSVAFRIRDLGKPVSLPIDMPLFYLRFFNENPYDTINLSYRKPNQDGLSYSDILRENGANIGLKTFAPGLSWEIIQQRFDGWKKARSLYLRKFNPFRGKK